ncbi:hypothetical protein V490_03312 [Pseudogymnoascus sp. VKM F-3557]|nr:hypothetical protein V490_03312 [Pseudogymnoascus sp. VKM F-3557]
MGIPSTTLHSQKSEQGLMFSRFQDLPAELRLKIWGMAMRAHVRVITTSVYFFSGYTQPRHINSENFEEDEEARQAVINRRKSCSNLLTTPSRRPSRRGRRKNWRTTAFMLNSKQQATRLVNPATNPAKSGKGGAPAIRINQFAIYSKHMTGLQPATLPLTFTSPHTTFYC